MKIYIALFFVLLSQFQVKAQRVITVAQDGTGQYTTVQAAFDAVPLNNKRPVLIRVKRGRYVEKLHLDSSKNFVKLVGEGRFNTILSYNDHTGKISPKGDTINTYTSESFLLRANDFTAEDISFENNAGFSAGQAVAVQAYGDRLKFINCRFLGNQDVLFLPRAGTRQYFVHCYIEGTTDFIFGSATAWFEQCQVHSKKNSHVTAASTPKEIAYGFVFNECVLTADTAFRQVSLGRPWRPFASVTYLHCYIDRHIIPEGWNNWKNPDNEKTARFSEYQSFGPGGAAEKRFSWTRQLTEAEAASITIPNIFKNWNPKL